jgi:ribonuclease HI
MDEKHLEEINNNEILDILLFLRQKFFGDDEALQALAVLEKKAGHLAQDIKRGGETRGPGKDFPLPNDMDRSPTSFAVFSDGACRGNPGPGAWGSVAQDCTGEVLFEASGVDLQTTNNRMELEGAIQGLKTLMNHCEQSKSPIDDVSIYLYSDSKYVVDGMNKWVTSWKKRGWKKADKKDPENLEQWKTLDELSQGFYKVYFRWVKGHSGHPQNEKCDELANLALDESGL